MNAVSFDIATLLAANGFGNFGDPNGNIGAMAWIEGLDEQILVLGVGSINRPLALQTEQPTFQILARGKKNDDMNVTYNNLQAIHEFLLPLSTTTINGDDYLSFFPTNAPAGIGRDNKDRAVFTANYSTFRNPL